MVEKRGRNLLHMMIKQSKINDFLLSIKVIDKGNNFEPFETAKDA